MLVYLMNKLHFYMYWYPQAALTTFRLAAFLKKTDMPLKRKSALLQICEHLVVLPIYTMSYRTFDVLMIYFPDLLLTASCYQCTAQVRNG